MPLDPQVAVVLAELEKMPKLWEVPLEVLRQGALPRPTEVTSVASVRDVVIVTPAGPIGGRLYRPLPGTLPLLVYFHGGGFVLGNLDSHDEICRQLAASSGAAVLAVDYRLAPEHKFPAATDDSLAAVRWAAANAAALGTDPARIAVGGDSAGGNLSAVTSIRLRDEGGPVLVAQMLIYPVAAHYEPPTRSIVENAEGYFLTLDAMKYFTGLYLPDEAATRHPHFAVLSTPNLAGLPPAYVLTAEFDPLRDEGEAYAARLREAGVDVETIRYDGMIHAFFGLPGIDIGRRAVEAAGAWLAGRFSRS
ncbi:MAG TPA: alpha/beta hydrolase [Stellaceae bacterium]|nr:alpha/beta hydrolase [Stellaceae bacterium]